MTSPHTTVPAGGPETPDTDARAVPNGRFGQLVARLGPTVQRPGTMVGFLATLGLALSALMPKESREYNLPLIFGFIRDWMNRGVGVAFMVSGGILLALAWIQIRPRPHHPADRPLRQALITACIWSLPLVFSLPFASLDGYAYLDQGWQLSHGMSPYVTGLSIGGGPFADHVSAVWVGTTTIYPPLGLRFAQLAVLIGGSHPYWSLVVLHLLDLAALMTGAWATKRLAAGMGRDVGKALWWYFNPLMILSGVAGLHNELLMTAFIMLGLMLARTRFGLVTGSIAIGFAAAVKQPAVVVLPALVVATLPASIALGPRARAWLDIAWRALVSAVSVAATFVLITWASGLGFGWLSALRVPGMSFTLSPTAIIAQVVGFFFRHATGTKLLSDTVTGPVGMVVAPIVAVWFIVEIVRLTPHRWPTLAWVGTLAFGLASPTLWPWYLIPIPVMFGLERLDYDDVRRRIAFVLGISFAQVVIEYTGFQKYGTLAAALILAASWLYFSRLHPGIARSLADRSPGPARLADPDPGELRAQT
ncbi:polyprenol phosphomannose-dependent alpha 1,6 mannosyltransferase MptB [Raineyella fluvialis]|uniref:Alpha-1,6-mannosyltransferase n=1 Tax=Raineyella fluvialis TaxID=2662261 RepID=A0A5Q2F9L4_9ACTN|nr:polyprenol phosphomannose-dependent alpha 1,6 mannosyltransferase MptB [Raineyella fluvialis]QGF23592.1 hypothetical protein Rai3103_07830 [Raineyella fluvialis]